MLRKWIVCVPAALVPQRICVNGFESGVRASEGSAEEAGRHRCPHVSRFSAAPSGIGESVGRHEVYSPPCAESRDGPKQAGFCQHAEVSRVLLATGTWQRRRRRSAEMLQPRCAQAARGKPGCKQHPLQCPQQRGAQPVGSPSGFRKTRGLENPTIVWPLSEAKEPTPLQRQPATSP